MFGGNQHEIGSLNENLVLNTAGKVKIRFGKKFVDLLDNNGELNIPAEILNRISALENEIKANVVISIEIFCKSIDDIIHFENLFVNHLSCNYDLKEIDNDRCVKDSYLCLNKDSKPRRENIADGVFVTQIKVNCYDFILPKYLENPVRFELDQKTQVKVLKTLC